MREEQIFAKTLEELSALAKEQGNMLSEEQVTEAFDKAKLNLGEPAAWPPLSSRKATSPSPNPKQKPGSGPQAARP